MARLRIGFRAPVFPAGQPQFPSLIPPVAASIAACVAVPAAAASPGALSSAARLQQSTKRCLGRVQAVWWLAHRAF